MEMPSMKRKRTLSKPKVWPVVNCLYDQLLQAKEALEKAKVALRKAKKKLYGAMTEYQDAVNPTVHTGRSFSPCGKTRCVAQSYSESGDCNDEACTTTDNDDSAH